MSPAAPHIAVSAAMNSELLFAPFFRGSSWDRWRSVLKAFAGESLTSDERELFRHVAERDPPTKAARELVAVAGRGGGKDSIASLLATVAAINFDPRGKLRPGEKAVVMPSVRSRAGDNRL